jgi:hypothetical protein
MAFLNFGRGFRSLTGHPFQLSPELQGSSQRFLKNIEPCMNNAVKIRYAGNMSRALIIEKQA